MGSTVNACGTNLRECCANKNSSCGSCESSTFRDAQATRDPSVQSSYPLKRVGPQILTPSSSSMRSRSCGKAHPSKSAHLLRRTRSRGCSARRKETTEQPLHRSPATGEGGRVVERCSRAGRRLGEWARETVFRKDVFWKDQSLQKTVSKYDRRSFSFFSLFPLSPPLLSSGACRSSSTGATSARS